MRVSGFTIARNAVKLGYPIELSMRSLLPLVDELVIAVGDSEDNTWDVVVGIGDPKIKPFRTVWDPAKRVGGAVLAEQTNLALARCTGDWAVYLQTDELLHEAEIDGVHRRLERYLPTPVEGLSFQYLHFFGSYQTVQDNWCTWYRREVRAVKTGNGVTSVGDAAGFRVARDGAMRRLIRADAHAHVYHYGWVRPPVVMSEKRETIRHLYVPEPEPPKSQNPYSDLGNLRWFKGSHPALMSTSTTAQSWTFDPHLEQQPPRVVRYARLIARCPRGFARICSSRVLLAWNTYVPAPKLR